MSGNKMTSDAIVLLLVLGLLLGPEAGVSASRRTCDSTHERESLSVPCSVQANLDRDVIWTSHDESTGLQTLIAGCSAKHGTCTNHQADRFQAELQEVQTTDTPSSALVPFRSILHIKNISREHHGVYLSCNAAAPNTPSSSSPTSSSPTAVSSLFFSSSPSSSLAMPTPVSELPESQGCSLEVYAKPHRPVCVARKIGDNEVTVTCWAADVFPSCECDITEIENDLHESRRIHKDVIVYKLEKKSDLIDASENNDLGEGGDDPLLHVCEAKVQVPVRGVYVYIAVMSPKARQVNKREMSVPTGVTKPVVINRTTTRVDLRHGDFTQKLCFHGKTLRVNFSCEAFGFPRMPEFLWFKNGHNLHPAAEQADHAVTTETVKNWDGTLYIHMSTLRVVVTEADDGQEVKCWVHDKDFTGSRKIQDNRHLDISWPPRENPRFHAIDGSGLKPSVTVITDTGLTAFECRVPGGRPTVSKTEVKCHKVPNTNNFHEEQHFAEDGNRIQFTVNGTKGETWSCICSGHHATECYSKTASLSINFTPHLINSAPFDASIIIGVTLAAPVGLIVLSCLIFMFVRKNACIYRGCSARYGSTEMENRNEDTEMLAQGGNENDGPMYETVSGDKIYVDFEQF